LQTLPKETIESVLESKFELEEGHRIVVEDQTDESIIYLNIPRKVNLDEFELTDEQLEMVAGGIVGLTLIIAVELVAIGYLAAAIIDEAQK